MEGYYARNSSSSRRTSAAFQEPSFWNIGSASSSNLTARALSPSLFARSAIEYLMLPIRNGILKFSALIIESLRVVDLTSVPCHRGERVQRTRDPALVTKLLADFQAFVTESPRVINLSFVQRQ